MIAAHPSTGSGRRLRDAVVERGLQDHIHSALFGAQGFGKHADPSTGSGQVYARAHDQTVADDYFSAMERVEQRLQLGEEEKSEVVKVQMAHSTGSGQVFQLIQKLEMPELCFEERLSLAGQLREALGGIDQCSSP